MGDSKMLQIVGFVVAAAGFVFHLIGWSVPFWVYRSVSSGSTKITLNYGLWRSCLKTEVSGLSTSVCASIENLQDWNRAVRAMEVLAFLLFIGAVVCLALKLFVMKDKDILGKIAMALCFCAGLFAIIGIIIFGAEVDETDPTADENYHFGFAFTIIGGLLGMIAGIVLVVDMVKS